MTTFKGYYRTADAAYAAAFAMMAAGAATAYTAYDTATGMYTATAMAR